jgi:hypothetical protein
MRHTKLNAAWGLTQLTAGDELILLKLLSSRGHVLSAAARRYVRWLMAHVVPDQRWGVSAGAPSDVTVHIKNGWLPYPVSQPRPGRPVTSGTATIMPTAGHINDGARRPGGREPGRRRRGGRPQCAGDC